MGCTWKITSPIFTKFHFALQQYLHVTSKFQLERSKTETLVLITIFVQVYIIYNIIHMKLGKCDFRIQDTSKRQGSSLRSPCRNTIIRLTDNFTNYKHSLAVQKCMKNFENCTIFWPHYDVGSHQF